MSNKKNIVSLFGLSVLFILIPKKKTMTLSEQNTEKLKSLHPKVREAATTFLAECNRKGFVVRITDGYRTFEKQQKLYNQGRTTEGKIVTNAKPGSSYHNYGLAFDCAIVLKDGKLNWDTSAIAPIGKQLGFTWGGDFKSIVDKPHYEMRFSLNWKDMLALHKNNKKDSEGYILI